MIERYCTEKGCSGGDRCKNFYRRQEGCCFEYVAADYVPQFRWIGVFGLALVCAPMGAARDLFIKPVNK